MNEPLQAYMKVGIVHFAAYPAAMKGDNVLPTVREVVEDAFFQAIEVTRIPNPEERAAVAHLLAQSGMAVGYGAQPVVLMNKLDIGTADAAERERALSLLRQAVDEAYELGASRFALLSGPNVVGPDRAGAVERTIAFLNDLCAYSESRGDLPVCLESFDYDVDKRALVGPNQLAAQVAARVRERHPRFGLMLDLSHTPQQHEPIREAVLAVKDHLVHAHVGNCIIKDVNHPLYGDQHPRFGHPLGENGVRELAEFLRYLLQIGYLEKGKGRVVAFEVKPATGEESGAIVANAKRTLQEAWASIEA